MATPTGDLQMAADRTRPNSQRGALVPSLLPVASGCRRAIEETPLGGRPHHRLALGAAFPLAHQHFHLAQLGDDLFGREGPFRHVSGSFPYSVSLFDWYKKGRAGHSGGDYIYQSRAFGRIGFICVMSGLVVWSLQWVAISGHLLASLGFAPLFITLGSHFRSAPLMNLGVQIQDTTGGFVVSIVVTFLTVLILSRGLRLFVRIQKWLLILTLAAMATIAMVFLLHRHDFDHALTMFLGQLGNIVPRGPKAEQFQP